MIILISFIYPKSNVLSVPSYLKKGDLLFCDFNPDFIKLIEKLNINIFDPHIISGSNNDHVAIYVGDNMFVEACPYHWDEKREIWIGVVTTHISMFNLWGTNITYGLISNVTIEQREGAINWALNELGNPYNSFRIFKFSENNYNYWRCGDLISESYKNQNINLSDYDSFVTPNDILKGGLVEIQSGEPNGFWYPGLYLKWFTISLFDYIEDISKNQIIKDGFLIFQSIIT
jgi:hypothetical protein